MKFYQRKIQCLVFLGIDNVHQLNCVSEWLVKIPPPLTFGFTLTFRREPMAFDGTYLNNKKKV